MKIPLSVTNVTGYSFRADSRIENSFVYMVLCQDEEGGPIYIKVGLSDTPVRRFQALRTGCPVPPRRLALCAVPSRFIAQRVEGFLLRAFEPWRTQGEWFCFDRADKAAFNAGWQWAFKKSAPRGWPLEWTHLPVAPLLKKWARNKAYVSHLLKVPRRGADADFLRDSGQKTLLKK